MTSTRQWLERRRTEVTRRQVGAVLLFTAGAVLGALALGVALARVGLYRSVPVTVLLGWVTALAAAVVGLLVVRRRASSVTVDRLARVVESGGHLRQGSIAGLTEAPRHCSRSLLAAADRQAAGWLGMHGGRALAPVRQRGNRSLVLGAAVGLVGASVFTMVGPFGGAGLEFWRPGQVLASVWAPIVVTVDRAEVRRGDSVTVLVSAPGRAEVSLLTRARGEPWAGTNLGLDSLGRAQVVLGPLQTDRFVRAASGRRTSETVHIQVTLPAFLAALSLSAQFPAYLERADEALFPNDSVFLPVGTRVVAQGQATVPLASVEWHPERGGRAPIEVDGTRFRGAVGVGRSGAWELVIVPAGDLALEDPNPRLHVTLIPDSVPTVAVPVPGIDTVAPTTLRQSLVIDVRDDYGITKVELESRRVSSLGTVGDPRVELLFLPEGRADRVVLPWVLDLNDRGFLPGDTAFYKIRAFDNSPNGQWAETREFALRLPSRGQLREGLRDAADALSHTADSLFRAQSELNQDTENLAARQERSEESGQTGEQGLDFEAAERAAAIEDEQTELLERAKQLSEELRELSESGWEAGVTNPEWHQQLAELQELLEQAMTPELEQTLQELSQALERLDAEGVQDALQQLQQQQAQLQEQLERSRELFERAALEGAMESLAEDAEDLASKQDQWNKAAQSQAMSDSALAAREQALAEQAEALQEQLDRLEQRLQQQGQQSSSEQMEQAEQQLSQAQQQMQQAASQAQSGQRQQAQQSGEQAAQQLDQMSDELREQLDQMREDFRNEVLETMDAALSETAELARRQEEVAAQMQRGESGAEVRGEQAAIREAVDRVMQRLQDASGKNALVSPDLGSALGAARIKMSEALTQFEQPVPNTRRAGSLAGEAVDNLNAMAAALMRNRGDVEGSSSGSGMAEAMQQMAEMAAQQEAINGQTGGILPLMPQGGDALLQQLQQLADQERAMGDELERMAAEDALPGATEELAEEAKEIARELEAGRLDRETLERQERLFRRLLDAGRSLRSEEEDEREERESETAEQGNVQLPPELDPRSLGPGSRYPYPRWEQLRRFSPEERRLIIDYFRRLNRGSG